MSAASAPAAATSPVTLPRRRPLSIFSPASYVSSPRAQNRLLQFATRPGITPATPSSPLFCVSQECQLLGGGRPLPHVDASCHFPHLGKTISTLRVRGSTMATSSSTT